MRVTSIVSVGSLLCAGIFANPCKPVTPSAASTSSVASVSSSVASVISSVVSSAVSSAASSSSAAPAGPATVCTKAGVLNPDFSNGLTSWDTDAWSSGASTHSVTAATDCGPDVNGVTYDTCATMYAASFQGSPGQAAVSQSNIPLVDGASYVLTFEYRITQAGSGILGCVVNSYTSASGISSVANTWLTYSMPIVASGEVIQIAPFQRSYGASMTVQFANIKLESCITTGGTTTSSSVTPTITIF